MRRNFFLSNFFIIVLISLSIFASEHKTFWMYRYQYQYQLRYKALNFNLLWPPHLRSHFLTTPWTTLRNPPLNFICEHPPFSWTFTCNRIACKRCGIFFNLFSILKNFFPMLTHEVYRQSHEKEDSALENATFFLRKISAILFRCSATGAPDQIEISQNVPVPEQPKNIAVPQARSGPKIFSALLFTSYGRADKNRFSLITFEPYET